VKSVIEAIAQSVQRVRGRPIMVVVQGAAPHRWALPEAESIPIALTVNELLTNALRHGSEGDVRCTVDCGDAEVRIEIVNPGRLPHGFELARVPGGVSGLGLVRALLPRRSAMLALAEQGGEVVATVTLKPPGVTLLDPL
jgi:signal transduction histidine kinase